MDMNSKLHEKYLHTQMIFYSDQNVELLVQKREYTTSFL